MKAEDEKHKERIKNLEKRIKELESTIESKDIIIEALISKIRVDKIEKRDYCEVDENDNQPKKVKKNTEELAEYNDSFALPGIDLEISSETADKSKNGNISQSVSPKSPNKVEVDTVDDLVNQIKDTFVSKSKSIDFKSNFSIEAFTDYAEKSFEFCLTNKKIFKSKNPLRYFITNNIDRIVKYVIDNINTFTMNKICSTIFLINSEIEYNQKLVIFHDIVLELQNFSKLAFIASALFNNLDLEMDLFSQMIKKILYHQLCIDYDLFKNTHLIDLLDIIRSNLSLTSPEISLWDSLSYFFVKHQIFDHNKKICSDGVQKGFIVRMTCHYLDWNYTYNTFIVSQLYPKIICDKAPIYVYYLGILMMNAKRVFNTDESITMIIDELKEIMNWKDECAIVAYLILKQLFVTECEDWLSSNSTWIVDLGIDIGYLEKVFLI